MIPEIAPYNNYTGNGSTTQFDFDFYIEDSTQLIVQHTSSEGVITTLTNGTDYSIHETGNPNGSYITFPILGSSYSKLQSNEALSLILTLPIAQESEYGTSSELDLRSLEYSLDYLTRICQIMNRQVTRALKVAEGSNISTDELVFDVEKIADISDDVSTVAEIAADVTAVKNNATNITTVAGSISNVDAVGESIANVNTVVTDLTNIDTVAGSISNVNTVGNNISSVNAVAGSIANIDTIKEDLTNIDNVADDLVNINAVAGSISNVDTVAAISSDVTTVKNNVTNINAVAADLTNINAVAADLTNIDAASSNAQLAKDWANKMNGTVDGYEYSAKYYAQQAAQGQVQANWNESDASSKAYIWNKPTIPDAQIQSDWNQADNAKKDYIKNKPNLAAVATSGNYSDLSGTPTIPAAQVNSDWNAVSGVAQILNKPTISNLANQDLSNLTSFGNSRLQYAPFAMNNGLINSSGNNITLNGDATQITIKCYPCTLTTADGRTFVDSEARTRDVSDWGNNIDYAVFKNVTTNELTTNMASRFSISPIAPSSPVTYWLDTSTIPANFKVYDGTNWNINNNLVWIGNFTKTNGIITAIKNRKINDSGYLVDRHIDGVVETYVNGTSWYRIYSDGWCEQGGRKTGASGQTITLMKSYANSNYHLSGSMLGAAYNTIVAFNIVDSSSFIVHTASGGQGYNSTSSWQASGYLA